MQGQCKPNAESSLFAEVQPVLAFSNAKLRRFQAVYNNSAVFRSKSMRQTPLFYDCLFLPPTICRMGIKKASLLGKPFC